MPGDRHAVERGGPDRGGAPRRTRKFYRSLSSETEEAYSKALLCKSQMSIDIRESEVIFQMPGAVPGTNARCSLGCVTNSDCSQSQSVAERSASGLARPLQPETPMNLKADTFVCQAAELPFPNPSPPHWKMKDIKPLSAKRSAASLRFPRGHDLLCNGPFGPLLWHCAVQGGDQGALV